MITGACKPASIVRIKFRKNRVGIKDPVKARQHQGVEHDPCQQHPPKYQNKGPGAVEHGDPVSRLLPERQVVVKLLGCITADGARCIQTRQPPYSGALTVQSDAKRLPCVALKGWAAGEWTD
jgi:hypothetical protein